MGQGLWVVGTVGLLSQGGVDGGLGCGGSVAVMW